MGGGKGKRSGDEEVGFGSFDAAFRLRLIPNAEAAAASAFFAAQAHFWAHIVEGVSGGTTETGFLNHPCFQQ